MGQSTNAIIAFGFDLGEELPEHLQDLMDQRDGDIEEVMAFDSGMPIADIDSYFDYASYKQAKEDALKQVHIDLIRHCSGEYPMYFLAARGSDRTAYRGSPTALESFDLDTSTFTPAVDAMRSFCERHGIEWQGAKWHIFSMWN